MGSTEYRVQNAEAQQNGNRSLHSLNGKEPTPNREQRVLAHFAEVRRRKTVGQWQSLPLVA